MIIEGVDPRDTEWEEGGPVYRVYFWHQQAAPPGVPQSAMGFRCDERRISGARDVHEVLAWAHDTARADQTFTLYVEHRDGDRPGLIRLAGEDPTEVRDQVRPRRLGA